VAISSEENVLGRFLRSLFSGRAVLKCVGEPVFRLILVCTLAMYLLDFGLIYMFLPFNLVLLYSCTKGKAYK